MTQPQLHPPLSRRDVALRYGLALLPMLFYGSVWVLGSGANDFFRPVRMTVDLVAGVLALLGVRWRRRRPLVTAVITALLTSVSSVAIGPAAVVYVSLCTHRRWSWIVGVGVVSEVALVVRSVLYGFDQTSVVSFTTGTVFLAMLTVVGLYVRTRRELDVSRVATEEAARRELVEQTRDAERQKMAHEMHDVLAHRVSLLSMLAGGLAFRDDLSRAETKDIATAIQHNAQLSLTELRTVLGSLQGDGSPEAPQPSLADVPRLVAEVERAGQDVAYRTEVDASRVPDRTGRHAYRVVQEALTNARKHAPGSTAAITLDGRPGESLTITVRNPLTSSTSGTGAGLGLIGLAERVDHVGGTLNHRTDRGEFELAVSLPWAEETP